MKRLMLLGFILSLAYETEYLTTKDVEEHEGREAHGEIRTFSIRLSVLRVLRNTMPESFRSLRKFSDGPELRDAGIYSRQDAKNAKLKAIFLGGLCAFARDNPRLTGARSAPYENLCVLRAFVVNPTFLILVAALLRCAFRGE